MTRFDLQRFERERAARGLSLGSTIAWPEETQSTNDDALAAAKEGAPHGAVFGAETQRRGRGRRGSEWISTPGAGLWFSVVLRPTLSPEATPALTLCAGLAVREAADQLVSGSVQVKWPNDVLAEGRKLAGVLVESQMSGAHVGSVVVGIGINCSQTALPAPIAELATSLALLGAPDASREALLANVLAALASRLALLERDGVSAIAAELRAHDALLGRAVRIDGQPGFGAGIDDEGRLLLRDATGQVWPQLSGHVELLPSARQG